MCIDTQIELHVLELYKHPYTDRCMDVCMHISIYAYANFTKVLQMNRYVKKYASRTVCGHACGFACGAMVRHAYTAVLSVGIYSCFEHRYVPGHRYV